MGLSGLTGCTSLFRDNKDFGAAKTSGLTATTASELTTKDAIKLAKKSAEFKDLKNKFRLDKDATVVAIQNSEFGLSQSLVYFNYKKPTEKMTAEGFVVYPYAVFLIDQIERTVNEVGIVTVERDLENAKLQLLHKNEVKSISLGKEVSEELKRQKKLKKVKKDNYQIEDIFDPGPGGGDCYCQIICGGYWIAGCLTSCINSCCASCVFYECCAACPLQCGGCYVPEFCCFLVCP